MPGYEKWSTLRTIVSALRPTSAHYAADRAKRDALGMVLVLMDKLDSHSPPGPTCLGPALASCTCSGAEYAEAL